MLIGYLTTREAAERLGVSVGRVQQLIACKRLAALKVGQANLIKASDLRFVQDRQNGRPPKGKVRKPFKTLFDVCPNVIGSVKDGLPADLSANKQHLADLGRKSSGRKGAPTHD